MIDEKINPEIIISKIIRKFDKKDLLIIITTFIVGIINNFYFIIGEGVAPDAVSPAWFNIAGNWEITLGRFGIKYINQLRYGFVSQFIVIIISLFLISVSIMIIKRIFNFKSNVGLVILTTLIACAPQFTETYFFVYCADAYLFAFFCSILSVYFLNKMGKNKLYMFLSILFVIITCSIYQAYLGVTIGLSLLLIIKQLIKNYNVKDVFINFFKYMLIIFAGCVFYYILLKLILLINNLTLASYKGANDLGLNTLIQMPKSIVQCYKDFFNFYFDNNIIFNSYYHRKEIFMIIFVLLILISFITFCKSDLSKKNVRLLAIFLIVAIYPIGINIMNIIAKGTKINLVTGPGLITFFTIMLFLYEWSDKNLIVYLCKWLLILLFTMLSVSYIIENSYTYIARNETYQNYKTTMTDIYYRAIALNEYNEKSEWIFNNYYNFTVRDLNRTNGFITHDNVTWKNYSGLLQNSSFFEKNLGVKIKMASREKYNLIVNSEEFKAMPTYPKEGSVKIIDGVVTVKISENSL